MSPLNPSPIPSNTLFQTQQSTLVLRWSDQGEPQDQRAIIVGSDNDFMADGSGTPYNAIELVCAEEAYELSQALLDQVEWLSHIEGRGHTIDSEPEPCVWVVTVREDTKEGSNTRVHGPLTRFAADCWADMEIQTEQVTDVAVTRLERPPLV